MEDGFDNKEKDNGEIFSKSVRAGKRTYFFDVKSTKGNDYYLTITESKKRFGEDGKFFYEKHKLFLYKEDFEKFLENLNESISFIKTKSPEMPVRRERTEAPTNGGNNFTDVNFEDLDK